MSSIFRGTNHALLTSTRLMSMLSRSMSTHQMKDGTSFIIREAGPQDYKSVIESRLKESRQDVSEMKLLQDAQVLADRCRGGDYHLVVLEMISPDDKVKDEVLHGTIGLETGLNVPKKFDTTPVEEKSE